MSADPSSTPNSPLQKDESVKDNPIASQLSEVRKRIEAACIRAGRDPNSVRLLPVSKTVPQDRLRDAYLAGCRLFGENKVQEGYQKWEAMSDLKDLQWSIIGHLQTNKIKYVSRFAVEFQALDSLKVAEELDRRLQAEGRSIDVFVQVNTSQETSKYGLAPEDVKAFVAELPAFHSLRVQGLMTLAIFDPDSEERVRKCFSLLRNLKEQLQQTAPGNISLEHLSMGMSGDFELAIEEGATVVRVGQSIFGSRNLPDSHYWPPAN